MRRLLGGRRQGRRALDDDRVLDAASEDVPDSTEDDWVEDAESPDSETGPEREFEPFVPVEAEGHRGYGDEGDYDIPEERSRRRKLHLGFPRPALPRWARPRLGIEVRGGILLLVVILVAAGVFGTLLALGTLRDSVEGWWPLAIIGGALIWMLWSLARRRVAPFLGAWALAGIGVSALMDTQAIAPVQDTALGIVLVAVGLGIAFRGFLLRQQAAL